MGLIPTQLFSWGAFRLAWPDATVLAPTNPLWRRWLSRILSHPPFFIMLPFFRRTLPPPDRRLPEGELGLGVVVDESKAGPLLARFYPLKAIRGAGIARDRLGDTPVVVASDPWSGNAVALVAEIDGRALELEVDSPGILQDPAGNRFDLSGRCIAGPLRGGRLRQAPSVSSRWYGFVATYPEATVWDPAGMQF
jgi:hypothetical protein